MQTREQRLASKKRYREKNQTKIKQYRKENQERFKKYNKEYYVQHYKSEADITLEQFNALYEKQHGRCRICGRHQNELRRRLCADHNHKTNKVRGLLCDKCNLVLGYANDNIIVLSEAIKYLNDHDNSTNT